MAASCSHSPFHCSLGASTQAQCLLEKGVVRHLHYGFSCRSFPRMDSGDSFRNKCGILSNPGRSKVWLSSNVKSSHATFAMASDRDASESGSLGELEKGSQNGTLFPDGIESFITEVCDETEIAEIKLKSKGVETRHVWFEWYFIRSKRIIPAVCFSPLCASFWLLLRQSMQWIDGYKNRRRCIAISSWQVERGGQRNKGHVMHTSWATTKGYGSSKNGGLSQGYGSRFYVCHARNILVSARVL